MVRFFLIEILAMILKDNEMKKIPSIEETQAAATTLVEACYGRAYNAGWWHDAETGEPRERPIPELLCLIHSEISEALEGYKKDCMDEKLPHRKMLEVELADAVIRLLDTAGGLGLDIPGALVEKMVYNETREDHTIGSRLKQGGKRI